LNGLIKKYLKRTNRPLAGYKIFKKQVKIPKKTYLFMSLFFMLLGFYILELTNVFDTELLMLETVAASSIIFILFPLLYIRKKRVGNVVLTSDALAFQSYFNRYRLIFFNDIVKVKQTKKNKLIIKGNKKKVKILIPFYEDNLNVLKTIMNYEGHFKQKRKHYKLFFEANRVDIQELTPATDPQTSRLVERFHDEYKHVTPGFIKDLIFYNAEVEKVKFIDETHFYFILKHIDLKGDYPENTHFEAMQTDKAMALFQAVSHVEIYTLGSNKKEDVQLLGTSLQAFKKLSKGALIIETNFKALDERMNADMVIMQGTTKLNARFTFKDIIIGFNELKQPSWFEN